MNSVVSIVEGHGETTAFPQLLRRIAAWRTPEIHVDVQPPIRVKKDRFLNREEEFDRYLRLAGGKSGLDGWVVILLDADDDCPAAHGPGILARARTVLPHRSVSVVLANREFEAWFIGAAASLEGHRGLRIGAHDLRMDPEQPRDAKGWLRERMANRSYGETTDQPAFVARMDLQQAYDRCRSFRKLCGDWDRRFGALQTQ
ncbi:hypothetical protein C7R54_13735 [Achromobacter aloeverae]|uniref:DUF4276 domain-containing protein n=1 Tax=Achromobacter aloeverae TaxID=1750518 RepID=A0A4Q1HN69_9BURK|nr:hypothetical protein C7R54_13735 [Achromobacter aloeverae]